jgi:alkylation response protein AidB-like acyl-CoA dehydrogenase
LQRHRIVDRARDLEPLVRARADETELVGTLPDDLAATLRDAGLLTMMVPAELGGEGADPVSALEAIELISRADGSTGWSVMANATGSTLTAALVGDRAADAIFGRSGGRAVVAGMLSPAGSCRQVEGGYCGTGNYSFGSGSGHADWIAGGMLVMDGDKPRRLESGGYDLRVLVVPKSAVEMRDNWDVFGLNGTGSFDYHIPEQFVADDFTYQITMRPKRGERWLELGVFAFSSLGHGAVALGIMGRALEEVATLTAGRKRLGYREGVGNHPLYLHDFAHHEAIYQSARAYMYGLFEQAVTTLMSGGELSDETHARLRQVLTYIHRIGSDVVEWCYRWGGTAALRNPHPLGRCLRDMHGATQHLFVDPISYVDAAPAIVASWNREA